MRRFQLDSLRLLMVTMYPCKPVKTKNPERHFGIANGIKNVMEDQYSLIYLSNILKSYLARKRRLADSDTNRKLAETLT